MRIKEKLTKKQYFIWQVFYRTPSSDIGQMTDQSHQMISIVTLQKHAKDVIEIKKDIMEVMRVRNKLYIMTRQFVNKTNTKILILQYNVGLIHIQLIGVSWKFLI